MLHVNNVIAPEREKYDEMWGHDEYHNHSPGLENVERFMSVVSPERGSSVIDVGCGAGVAGIELRDKHGMRVTWVDFTEAGLDPRVDRNRFRQQPIWEVNGIWQYGFCCDVMEHVPTEFTMLAIDRMLHCCSLIWLQIAFVPDAMGQLIGKPLHMTVQPFEWWRDRIAVLGDLIEARDLGACGVFAVEQA